MGRENHRLTSRNKGKYSFQYPVTSYPQIYEIQDFAIQWASLSEFLLWLSTKVSILIMCGCVVVYDGLLNFNGNDERKIVGSWLLYVCILHVYMCVYCVGWRCENNSKMLV